MIGAIVCWSPRPIRIRSPTALPQAGEVGDCARRHAVDAAIVDVLRNAIAFSPTMGTIQNARAVADRIYILLLIADADGEKTLEVISAERSAPSDPEGAREPSE